jgi:hypothetical protein
MATTSEQVSKALKHHVLSSEFKALFHLQRHFRIFTNSAINLKHPVRQKLYLKGNSLRIKYAIIQGSTNPTTKQSKKMEAVRYSRHIDSLRVDKA